MSFTDPSSVSIQSRSFWNEIQLAYSERRQAIGQSAAALFQVGHRWQDRNTLYRVWQEWLENTCTYFVDNVHVNGPLNDAGAPWRYWTLATWRTAAGIDPAGFIRIDANGVQSRGRAQSGDKIHADLIREIQDGFSALQWSPVIPTLTKECWDSGNVSINEDDGFSALKSACLAAYHYTGPGSGSNARAELWNVFQPIHRQITARLSRSICTFRVVKPAGLTAAVDLYCLGAKLSGGTVNDFDANGDPVSESWSVAAQDASSAATPIDLVFGSSTPPAWSQEPPSPTQGDWYNYRGYNVTSHQALMKWQFTN